MKERFITLLCALGALGLFLTMFLHKEGPGIGGKDTYFSNMRVPIDNESLMFYRLRWKYSPIPQADLDEYKHGEYYYPALVPGSWQTKDNVTNDYNIDRVIQKSYTYTGIRTFPLQDIAMMENQWGPIADRTQEHLTSSEVGLKTLLANHRVRLNTAAFYNQYEDIQVLLSSGTTIVIANAAKATIYGLEADLEAAVTDHWTVQGSLGYAHNGYDEWHDGSNDFSWRKLRNAPEWTGNLASAYEWRLANTGGLS